MGANTSGLENPQVTELHSKNQWRTHFDACIQSDKLMVIYFTAVWCVPCKFFEPYVNELAAKYTDVQFIKIDIDKIPEAVQAFELVELMPTFILTKRGIEMDRVVGAKTEELQTKTEKHRIFH